MSEQTENEELEEPRVTDVPEPDQRSDDETSEEEAAEAERGAEEPAEASEARGVTPEQIEKVWKDTDRAVNAYVKKVSGIWEDAGLALTPFGLDPGAPLGFVNMDNAGRVDEQTQKAVLTFLGFASEKDYEPDPETERCATCKGEGKTATGSRVPGNASRKCPTCLGFGYTPPPKRAESPNGPAADFHAPIGEHAEAVASGEVDMWQEPRILPDGRENPNFGKLPQHKVTIEPWGVTAGLSAQDAAV